MDLTDPKAFSGLVTTANPQGDNLVGSLKLGKSNEQTSLTSVTKVVSFDGLIQGSGSDLVIDVSDLDSTGSTAWSSGTAQVETATAVGTVTADGTAEVVFTSSRVTGSPVTLQVPVLAADAPINWAPKVIAALQANTAITAAFDIGGSGDDITATEKGTIQPVINGTATPSYPANDATLNISLDNGTSTGITAAPTSTNTTAGVASSGAYAPALDGTDFEGISLGGASAVYGVYIKNNTAAGGDGITITQSTGLADLLVPAQGVLQIYDASGGLDTDDITIETENDGPCLVEVVIAAS